MTGRVANSEWRVGMRVERDYDQVVSRFARVARCHGARGGLLSPHPWLSKGGIARIIVADQAVRCFDTRKYRRGTRSRKHPIVHSVSAHLPRLTQGAGDAFAVGNASWCCLRRGHPAFLRALRFPGAKIEIANK